MFELTIRAAILDGRIYRLLDNSPEALFRSMGVVLVAAVAFALGARTIEFTGAEGSQVTVVLLAVTSVLTSWALWSFIAFVVGRILGGSADYRLMLRSLGLVFGPGVLLVFMDTPAVGPSLFAIGKLWMLAAGFVAVSEAHKIGLLKAFVPTVLGWTTSQLLLPLILLGLPPTQVVG